MQKEDKYASVKEEITTIYHEIIAGTSADNDLSADGKGNQFLQPDGGTVLHHDGRADGYRWDIR